MFLFSRCGLSPYSRKGRLPPPPLPPVQSLPQSTCPMHSSSSKVRTKQLLLLRKEVLPDPLGMKMQGRRWWGRRSPLLCPAPQGAAEFRSLVKMDMIRFRLAGQLRRIPPNTAREHGQGQMISKARNQWGLGAASLSVHGRYASETTSSMVAAWVLYTRVSHLRGGIPFWSMSGASRGNSEMLFQTMF